MYNSRSIDDLRPDVAKNARLLLEECALKGLSVLVTGTVRDKEYQESCYKAGTSRTKTPSFHACGCGLAFDICKNVRGQEYSDTAFFERCAVIGKRMGFEWGGDWTSIVDMPHFQWSGGGRYTSAMILDGQVPPQMPPAKVETAGSRYEPRDGIHFRYTPAEDFRVLYWDKPKKTTDVRDYANGGFFAEYSEVVDGKTVYFTLPVANLVADITEADVLPVALKYLREWGTVAGGKVRIDCRKNGSDQFKGKAPSTLVIDAAGRASIRQFNALPADVRYAISGVPVMIGGKDVSWSKRVLPEGWKADIARATWHTLLGLLDGYVVTIGMQTTAGNCITSSEAYAKLAGYGFTDVILLDGGGSFVFDHDGKNVAVTAENRRVNTLVV